METNDNKASLKSFEFHPDALILGGGDFPIHAIPLQLLQSQKYLVCCDGAVNQCIIKELHPWRVIGDGDSISPEALDAFRSIIRISSDQETNDQTKAVTYLSRKGKRHIAILAATGRREDHTLGNISLLIEYMRQGLEVRMYTDYGVFIPCKNTTEFQCPIGTAVSVFSFGTHGMESEGLAYPLYDFKSWWQGTLNHTLTETFCIKTIGEYLVYLTYENKKIRE